MIGEPDAGGRPAREERSAEDGPAGGSGWVPPPVGSAPDGNAPAGRDPSVTEEAFTSARRGSPLRVGIVEDLEDVREGLRAIIGRAPGFACSGAWGSMELALDPLIAQPPDVVLVDIGLPGMSGIEGIARLKAHRPEILPVVLTVYQDDDRIFRALCAGARGYLLKKTPAPRLLAALEEAAGGGAPMSPEIARQVVDLFTRYRPVPQSDHGLTPHELRVLGLLVEGYDLATAARRLGVARPTVAFHVRRIYEKLEVHSKSEAVAKALRSGLVR